MSIPLQTIRQRDFTAGEVDPDAERRDDSDLFKYGVKYARNLQSLRVGGLERRPGRRWLYNDAGVRDEFRPFGDTIYSVTFANGRATIRNEDGTRLAQLSAPWVTADLPLLVWEAVDNTIIVCGPFRTRVIEVDRVTREWSIREFEFAVGLAGKVLAPFRRFEADAITMQPSAIEGDITLTFSAPILTDGHVGVVVRFAERQIRITGIVSPTVADATVIEKLNPTVEIQLSNPDEIGGFTVGEVASTSDSGVEIEIVEIDVGGLTVTGVILNRYRKRNPSDRLVGPTSDADTSDMDIVDPGATTQWDEIFMSDLRGWPRSVSSDVQRVIFTDFAQKKNTVVWSAVNGNIGGKFDFGITGEATGAILESIQSDCRVYHVIGGYDEFALTDTGVFYIPISGESPLAPGSVEFRLIYAGEVARVRPVKVTEGVLFVDKAQTGIYAVTATGQTARPYIASEITEFRRHLFNGIKSIAATVGTPASASRQIFAVNADGTMVIGQYNADRNYVGWLKWTNARTVTSVSCRYEGVVLSSTYLRGSGGFGVAERIDPTAPFDCSITVQNGDFSDVLTLSTGEPLTLSTGEPLSLSSLITVGFAGATMQVMADGFFFGNVVVGPNGEIEGFEDYDEVTVGFSYSWSLKPNLGAFEGGESFGQRLRRRKVSKVMAKVRDTQEFQIGNRLFAGYVGGDDTALPMPLRNGTFTYRQIGRSYDPEYEIKQSQVPGSFKLLELTTELTV